MFQPQALSPPGQHCLTTSNSVLHYHCLLLAVAELFTPDLLAAVMFSGCHHLSLCASGVAIFLRQLAPTFDHRDKSLRWLFFRKSLIL